MADNGEQKLIAVARHIANTLGHTDNMTDDIIKIFSNFDGRLREKLMEKLSDEDPRDCATLEHTLKSLDRQISHYVSSNQPIWSDTAEASSFLDSVDQLISSIRDWTQLARAGESSWRRVCRGWAFKS
ncbi:Exocyst complex component EXO70B1 [Forsythia ovata]|uniref:Exocyst complex component EXO70B1 n=1 Tax=Forsythia ovata TaxID=205694 RepID=A0ABD1TUF8_9LAMI